MRLYLIRHGEYSLENGYSFDINLSETGIRQGRSLIASNVLPTPDKIYSSHFVRAKESAQILAEHFKKEVSVKKCLGEWKIQEVDIPFDKYSGDEKKAKEDHDLIVSGGESITMAKQRIYDCVLQICKEDYQMKNVFIISHGNVLYLLFKKILNEQILFPKSEVVNNFDYGVLEYSKGNIKVIRNIIIHRPL